MTSKNGTKLGLQDDNQHYVTQKGVTLTLVPVNPAMLQGLSDLESRPEPPLIEVTIAGKHKQWITHYDSDGYQAALAAWQNREQFRIMVLTFCMGIADDPPAKWVKESLRYMPELEGKDRELKYRWVMSSIDMEEMGSLMEALTGQTMPTQAGLEEAANSFPD